MPSAVEEIRATVLARLREVETEIESLRSALEALDAEAAASAQIAAVDPEPPPVEAPRVSPARSRRSRAPGRRGGREPREDPHAASRLAELEARLAETGGPEAVALARETGIDPAEVLARIGELERAGRARD